jgi:hypothetical protein
MDHKFCDQAKLKNARCQGVVTVYVRSYAFSAFCAVYSFCSFYAWAYRISVGTVTYATVSRYRAAEECLHESKANTVCGTEGESRQWKV